MKLPWRILLPFWTIVAFFFVLQNASSRLAAGKPIDWEWDVWSELLYWALWAALTPPIVYWLTRFPLKWNTVALHSLGAAVVAVLQVSGFYAIHIAALLLLGRLSMGHIYDWLHVRPAFPVVLLFTAFWKYWVVVALLRGWQYARLYVDAQRRLEHAQLERLKSQLQPHFLFNTLNSISVLVREDPAAAQQMIVQLSDLLRLAIDTKDAQRVTLREELEFTRRYLAIQQLRFGNRLQVRVAVEPDALDREVPHLLLQPLVENSIQHGLRGASAGSVETTASVKENQLVIRIADEATGVARTPEESDGRGTGLANARARLAFLYGGRAELSLVRNGNGGSVVTIKLPLAE
jgi:two-component system, LytTR family, sensor kinase